MRKFLLVLAFAMIPGLASATVTPPNISPIEVNVTVPPAPVVGSGVLCQDFKADGVASKVVSCTPIVASSGFGSISACRSHFKSYMLTTDLEAHAGLAKDDSDTAPDIFTNIKSFVKYSCTAS